MNCTARDEILALLSDGLRNAAIAKRLFVSTKTVDHRGRDGTQAAR
jgi:DNA-binding CsgD family transcriptional regulator